MEWFVPSAFVILLGAFVFFLILPKFAPYLLGAIALILFFMGAVQHYSMFPYEYRATALQGLLSDYSPFLMLVAIIFGGTTAIMVAYGGAPPAIVNALPEILPATDTKVNGGIANIFKANNSKENNGGIANMFKANNSKANNVGIANMFKTNNSKKSNLASTSFMTV